jgi:Holliday junction DNA helicase RuvA
MITKMTGLLVRVHDEEVRLAVGAFEYQVLVPEAVRRVVQMRAGQEVTLHITEYLEGNSGGNRFVPRKIGFMTEAELEFFDLFCTVEKIGAKKALKAMARPVRDIADAIQRQDTRWLTTLPGIGATTAEQIVTSLKRKVATFAAMTGEPEATTSAEVEPKSNGKKKPTPAAVAEQSAHEQRGRLIEDVYEALMGLGHTPIEARTRLDGLLTSGKAFANVNDALTLIYSHRG